VSYHDNDDGPCVCGVWHQPSDFATLYREERAQGNELLASAARERDFEKARADRLARTLRSLLPKDDDTRPEAVARRKLITGALGERS